MNKRLTTFLVFILFLILGYSCSKRIVSLKEIEYSHESFNFFFSADNYYENTNLFYVVIDSSQLSVMSNKFRYKTGRAHLDNYYPGIIVTKENKISYSVPGKTISKSNFNSLKDSLELRVRKKKNLEKASLISFIEKLKIDNTPYYLLQDISKFDCDKSIKIEYNNTSNTYDERKKIIDSILNFFDSTITIGKSRFIYSSQIGKIKHTLYFSIPCDFKDEINEKIYDRIKSVKTVEIEKYIPIKYTIFYFEKQPEEENKN